MLILTMSVPFARYSVANRFRPPTHKDDEPFIETEAFHQSLRMFGMPPMTPPKIDQYIDPQTVYSFGNVSFSVLETQDILREVFVPFSQGLVCW
jgi:hypothetical protein